MTKQASNLCRTCGEPVRKVGLATWQHISARTPADRRRKYDHPAAPLRSAA